MSDKYIVVDNQNISCHKDKGTQLMSIKSIISTNEYTEMYSIDWKKHYILSRASIFQLMVTLFIIRKRFIKSTDCDVYKKVLQSEMIPIITDLLLSFQNLLNYDGDNQVISDFYGKIASFNLLSNLPQTIHVIIDEDDDIKRISNLKFGPLIKHLKQRCQFMAERDMPICYKNDDNLILAFRYFQKRMTEFLNDIQTFEEEFIDVINKAHQAQQKKYSKTK